MKIRAAGPYDAEPIARLHADNWRRDYAGILPDRYLAEAVDTDRQTIWRERLRDPYSAYQTILIEAFDGSLAGFGCYQHNYEDSEATFLDNLHTSMEARGKGFGSALLKEVGTRTLAARSDASLFLWVFEKNAAARKFYARHGGREVEYADTQWDLAPGEWRYRVSWDADALQRLVKG